MQFDLVSPTSTERYVYDRKRSKIGEGAYGCVYRAIDMEREDRPTVAIKEVHDWEQCSIKMYREIYILRRLRHVSIIPLIDAFFPKYNQQSLIQLHDALSSADTRHLTVLPRPLCFAFEFMDCDLQKYLKLTSTILSQEQIQYMMFQLLCGLQYIHSKNVIHRDLKSENILINLNSCSAKIADFGLSRVDTLSDNKVNEVVNLLSVSTHMDTDDEALPSLSLPRAGPRPVQAQRGYTKHIATRHYRAPEVILLQPYSAPVDVWSMGCIFGEMLGREVGNKDAYGRRDALMPGSACGELSPKHHDKKQEQDYREELFKGLSGPESQLNVIFDCIGNPTDEDLAPLDPLTAQALRLAPRSEGKGLERLLPSSVNTLAMDLLKRMLTFNPRNRITVSQAMNHPFFEPLKRHQYFQDYIHRAQNSFLDGSGDMAIEEIDDSSREISIKNLVEELLHYR